MRRKIPVDGPGSWINGLNEHYLKKWKLLFKKNINKEACFFNNFPVYVIILTMEVKEGSKSGHF